MCMGSWTPLVAQERSFFSDSGKARCRLAEARACRAENILLRHGMHRTSLGKERICEQ